MKVKTEIKNTKFRELITHESVSVEEDGNDFFEIKQNKNRRYAYSYKS